MQLEAKINDRKMITIKIGFHVFLVHIKIFFQKKNEKFIHFLKYIKYGRSNHMCHLDCVFDGI